VELVEQDLTKEIIGAAIDVHKHWGPGLYEEIYEKSLFVELKSRGLDVECQLPVELRYKDEVVGNELRLDMIVEGRVVIENKHVQELLPIHEAQLMTYLKLAKCRVGLLMNFNTVKMIDGIKRIIV